MIWNSFLAGQLHVFRPRADLGRCLLTFLPILGAILIAISRTEDYRHDVWDVTAGAVLGASVAYTTYRRYYPALTDIKCHVPYDRTEASFTTDGFAKLADDEEMALDSAGGGSGNEA